MPVKILYFAWVREKTGKAEEIVDLPAGIGTVAELVALVEGPRSRVCGGLCARRRRPRGRRSHARQADAPSSPEHARSPSSHR